MIKRISGLKNLLQDNRGETIMEVVVSFLILSIMMVLFAQGLKYAGNARTYAIEECDAADKAIIALQKTINNVADPADEVTAQMISGENIETTVSGSTGSLVAHQYRVQQITGTDIRSYYYWVYEVKDNG